MSIVDAGLKSGVVDEQIWSNTKFRICLKVATIEDSREMLGNNDAASIKETGRFYLQVGYDEYFALGQSAWCGAKYYPSEKILKQVDRSINFIDDTGAFIKSIQSGNKNVKIDKDTVIHYTDDSLGVLKKVVGIDVSTINNDIIFYYNIT